MDGFSSSSHIGSTSDTAAKTIVRTLSQEGYGETSLAAERDKKPDDNRTSSGQFSRDDDDDADDSSSRPAKHRWHEPIVARRGADESKQGQEPGKQPSKRRRHVLLEQHSSDSGRLPPTAESASEEKNGQKDAHDALSPCAGSMPISLNKGHSSRINQLVTAAAAASSSAVFATSFPSEDDHDPRKIDPNNTKEAIIEPGERDVLLGRGRCHREHLGNQFLHHLVTMQREQYDKSNREDKTDLTRYIVRNIREEGGRFLKRDKTTRRWREVSDEEARNKVSHAMRDNRRNSSGGSTEMLGQGTDDLPPLDTAATASATATSTVGSSGMSTPQPPPVTVRQQEEDLIQTIHSLLRPPAVANMGFTAVEESASSFAVRQMIPGFLSQPSPRLSIRQLHDAALVQQLLSSTTTRTTTATPGNPRSIVERSGDSDPPSEADTNTFNLQENKRDS